MYTIARLQSHYSGERKDTMSEIVLDCFPLGTNLLPNIDERKLRVAFEEHLRQYWGGIHESVAFHTISVIDAYKCIHEVATTFSIHGIEDSKVLLMVLDDVIQPNGHAFLFDGLAIAYYAIKAGYSLEYHRVFSTHEIIHAIHYQLSPTCYFNTIERHRHTGRQLLTEGIATTLSAQILNISMEKALWADIWPKNEIESWIRTCADSREDLFANALLSFNKASPLGMFDYVIDAEPIISRSGYWIGANFIQHLINNGWSHVEILAAPYSTLSPILKMWLEQGGA